MFQGLIAKLFGAKGVTAPQVSTPPPKTVDVSQPAVKPEPSVFVPEHKLVKKPTVAPVKPSVEQQQEQKRLIELLTELKQREKDLDDRLRSMEEKERYLRGREQVFEQREKDIDARKDKLAKIIQDEELKLEQIATLSKEEAKKLVLDNTEKRLAVWVAKKIEESKEAIKAQEEEISREILLEAIRHGVTDWVAEYTVSTIKLENEDAKGGIIGREGKNIRAFEKATGVELELDETLDIRLSSYDSVRREIARVALEKLIRDGRIQPTRIEEVVDQVKGQMDKHLLEEGKRICQQVGVYNLPIDLIKIIGKFKYRFSYGQNLAQHTIEETRIGVALATEMKADVKIVRLGCLLHDIGKVITDEEGSHIQLGVDLLKQYHLPEKVVACVAEHHEDKPFSCVESIITWIADAASGSRPGARYEAHEQYLKRMENIEAIVKSFEGIVDVSAYQAGREVRVIVKPDLVSDAEMTVMVQKMAEKLDEEAKWAGQIKITAIRETRSSATAPVNGKN